MILTKKQQKYQHYRQVKLINMNIVQVKKYYHLIKELIITKLESTGSKHLCDFKAFLEYPSDNDDIYKNIKEYNKNKKRKVLFA